MARTNSLCRVVGVLSFAFWLGCEGPTLSVERAEVPLGPPIDVDRAGAKTLTASSRAPSNVVSQQLTGATPGELETSSVGAAQYHVDIRVPPGTAGMQPKLSLDYDSTASNGLLGLGWSITGVSRITRCPTAIDPDGFIDAVDFDALDRYCLDGARLVAVVGAYGEPQTEYRTEIDSYQKIVSQGRAASGPEWFQVYAKDGRILEFGRTADSRIEAQGRADVLTWSVNRVEDRSDNYMTFTYVEVNDSGVWAPSRVDYSGHAAAGVSPYNHVEFAYELRPDGDVGYVSGTKMMSIARLNRIYTYADESLVREYRLAYDQSPSNARSRLISLTECGADNQCLRPTKFEWGARGLGGAPSKLGVGFDTATAPGGVSAYFDANGDGAADKVWTPCGSLTDPRCTLDLPIYVALSNGGGFGPSQLWLANGTGGVQNSSPGHYHEGFADFDGDGLQDFFVIPNVGGEQLYVARNTSKKFDTPKSWLGPQSGASIRSDNGQHEAMVDLDGDGRTDRVWVPAGTNDTIRASLSTGQNLEPSRVWLRKTGPSLVSFFGRHERFIDLNADRMADRVWVADGTNDLYVALSTGTSFDAPRIWLASGTSGVQPVSSNGRHEDFADVNGDGYLDFLFIPDGKEDLYAAISTGAGFLPPTVWLSGAESPRSREVGPRDEQYVDFNGDGCADRVWTPFNDDALYIAISNRVNGFNEPGVQFRATRCRQRNPVPEFEPATYVDVTGDGQPDRLWIPAFQPDPDAPCNPAEPIQVWIVVGSPLNERVVAITDGVGKRDEVTYQSSVAPALYRPERPQYPQVEFRDAQYLVSELRRSDGIGGFHTWSFLYGGLKHDVRKQRDLGFSFIEQFDTLRQTKTKTTYNQQYPLDHTERMVETRLAPSDQLLMRKISDWRSESVGSQTTGNLRQRIQLATETEESFELDGSFFASRSTARTYDDFGNVKTLVSSSSDGFGKSSSYEYFNDGISWLLGLVTNSTLTSTSPEAPAITRSTQYDYYPVTGLEKKRTTEPMTKLELVREYERDVFGNAVKETVTGADIETRVSETRYDVRGRFPSTLINAMEQPIAQTYDRRFGGLESTTDPNLLTASQTYDALGRADVTTDADGTKTFTSSILCSTALCPKHGAISITKQRQGRAAVQTVLDAKGREIQTVTTGTDGRTIFTETEYDAVGRVKTTTSPFYEGATPQRTTREYDALDRLRLETKPDQSKITIDYEGYKRTLTNDLQQKRTEIQNSQNQLTSVTDAYGKSTTYRYDATGNLTSVTDPTQSSVTMTYDNLGRRLTITDPDLGFRKSDYDVLGQLTGEHDAAGKGSTLRYDRLGRLRERTDPEGVTTWIYDTAANGVGKVARVYTNGTDLQAFDQSFSYDALSRRSGTTTAIGGKSFTVARAYDAFSRPLTTTYPSGFKTSNVYSALGYLARVENAANRALLWKADEYNAAGNVIRSTLGNGLSVSLGIDPATDRLETVRTGSKGGAEAQNLKYDWTTVGTLKGRQDLNQGLTESFLYDDLNRLTDATIADRAPLKVKYDDAGNVTEKSDVGIYRYAGENAGPHAVSSTDGAVTVRYLYDERGNQTSRTDAEGRTVAEMRYASFDKPIFIERDGSRSDFVYGPQRELVVRIDANANPARGPSRVIRYVEGLYEEIVGQATEAVSKRHYLRAGDQTIAVYTEGQEDSSSAMNMRYPLSDHLSSVDAVTDEGGVVIERHSFDAFGRRRNPDWTPAPVATLVSTLDKGFTGHEQLDHLGLVHMGARVYDPVLGRFTSADPTVAAPNSTQGFNRYTYADNSPLSLIDPTGFAPIVRGESSRIPREGGSGGYVLFRGPEGSIVVGPKGTVQFCNGKECYDVKVTSPKEGGAPEEDVSATADDKGGERPAACSGASCGERVRLPSDVEKKFDKGFTATAQGKRETSIVEKIEKKQQRIADEIAGPAREPSLLERAIAASSDDPFATLALALGSALHTAERARVRDQVRIFSQLDDVGFEGYNASQERKGLAISTAAGATVGATIGYALTVATKAPVPGANQIGTGAGALTVLGGVYINQQLLLRNKDIYRLTKYSEVTPDGEVRFVPAFSAVAK